MCAAVMMSQLPVVVTEIISKSSPSPRWGESDATLAHRMGERLGVRAMGEVLWKVLSALGNSSNRTRHDVRLKTGSRVQLAGGHHADNGCEPSNRIRLNAKETANHAPVAPESEASNSLQPQLGRSTHTGINLIF